MSQTRLDLLYVGSSRAITITFLDENGALENITDHTIELSLSDDDGNTVTKSGGDITISPQSGETLGQASVLLEPADTSATWPDLALGLTLDVKITKTSASGFVSITRATWELEP